MEDGTLVEPDIYTPSQSDNDPMASIQKPRPVQKASAEEPEEKELTGMEALLASRPKATARKDSNVHLSALLDQIYGEGQGQQLLG